MTACGWEAIGCDDCSAFTGLDPELQAEYEAWAVNRLWQWTGERFGLCEITIHNDDPRCCGLTAPYGPNYRCRRNELFLPGPAQELLLVTVAGEEVPLEDMHIDDYSVLVRDVGGGFGTNWEVTYTIGEPVPPGGELVAGILACEYAKSKCGDSSCRLPKRVSSVQRQGIVINNTSSRSTEEGITGIFEIDDWIMSANKPRRRTVVSSPDVPRPRIMTWHYVDS